MANLDGIRAHKKTFAPKFAKVKPIITALLIIAAFVLGIKTVYSFPLVHSKISFLHLLNSSGRYLVLFQNNRELRPTGGFIGSFAVIEQEKGEIKTIYVDTNIYKRDNAFTQKNTITPPAPLDAFVPEGAWAMRDSNWAVNYPDAAEKVAWFYRQEGGTDVDGVFALNASVFKDILNLIGPINLPKYNLTISADNFYQEVQMQVEKAYYENADNKVANEPKTILKDMLPIVISRAKSWEFRFKVVGLLAKELAEKQILFYFKNLGLQQAVIESNWGGQVKNTDGDYLYINEANLSSNKSSLDIKEDIRLKSQTKTDQTINELRIIRTHSGSGEWPGGDNKNYTRVLVPLGAKIISCQRDGKDYLKNVKIQTEAGKTVFAFWNNTTVGTSNVLEIKYKIPLTFAHKKYKLLWQKQSGTTEKQFNVESNGQKLFDDVINKDVLIS